MNTVVISNESNMFTLHKLMRLLQRFGIVEYTSYGAWMKPGCKTYMDAPLSEDNKYGMANCLIIDYTTRSDYL